MQHKNDKRNKATHFHLFAKFRMLKSMLNCWLLTKNLYFYSFACSSRVELVADFNFVLDLEKLVKNAKVVRLQRSKEIKNCYEDVNMIQINKRLECACINVHSFDGTSTYKLCEVQRRRMCDTTTEIVAFFLSANWNSKRQSLFQVHDTRLLYACFRLDLVFSSAELCFRPSFYNISNKDALAFRR